jgi:hypothetical protein
MTPLRRRLRAATAFVLAALACGAADRPTEGADAMMGTLHKIIPESQAVALVRFGRPTPATQDDVAYLVFPSEVLESLRGLGGGVRSIEIAIPEAEALGHGETPHDALVFLQSVGARYRLTMFSEPVEVPEAGREAFLKCAREWIDATGPGTPPLALRQHVVRMLASDIPFYVEDAARAALDQKGFADAEVEQMVALVEGEGDREPVRDITRDNLLAVIFRDAAPERAIELGRELLPAGAHREIYLGLAERERGEAETITRGFLGDPKEKVQIGGVLVAGLLRRGDLIDAFEEGVRGQPSPALRAALDQGRAYVKREL